VRRSLSTAGLFQFINRAQKVRLLNLDDKSARRIHGTNWTSCQKNFSFSHLSTFSNYTFSSIWPISVHNMPCTITSIVFISKLAERSANGAKLAYEVYFNPDVNTFIPGKLTAWQSSTPTDEIKAGDSVLCVGRAYFELESCQMLVMSLNFFFNILLHICVFIYCVFCCVNFSFFRLRPVISKNYPTS